MPHVNVSILVVIQLFLIVTTRRVVFFVDTDMQRGLYLVNELATMAEVFKEHAQEQMEDCSALAPLKTYNIFLGALLFWRRDIFE